MSKHILTEAVPNALYLGNSFRMSREYGDTPNGNPINGRWVLRDQGNNWVDFDKYRNDLAERNDIELQYPKVAA